MTDAQSDKLEAFEKWKEKNLTIGHDGLIKAWTYKMRGKFTSELSFDIFQDCFLAGQKSKVKMPDFREVDPDDREDCRAFAEGFNSAINEITRINAIEGAE